MKVCKTASTLHLSLPPPKITSEWTLFPKEHRSNGAKIRNRPSDSSNAKSNPVHSHHLPFLFRTKWIRRTSEPRRGRPGQKSLGWAVGPARTGTETAYLLGLGPRCAPSSIPNEGDNSWNLPSEVTSYSMPWRQRDKVTGLSHRVAHGPWIFYV